MNPIIFLHPCRITISLTLSQWIIFSCIHICVQCHFWSPQLLNAAPFSAPQLHNAAPLSAPQLHNAAPLSAPQFYNAAALSAPQFHNAAALSAPQRSASEISNVLMECTIEPMTTAKQEGNMCLVWVSYFLIGSFYYRVHQHFYSVVSTRKYRSTNLWLHDYDRMWYFPKKDLWEKLIKADNFSTHANFSPLILFGISCRPHIGKGKLGTYAMKRVAAGAYIPTPWLFEPAKRPDDRADYCLDRRFFQNDICAILV